MLNNKDKKTWILPEVILISSGSGIIEGGGTHVSIEKSFSHRIKAPTSLGGFNTRVATPVEYNSAHS
jgi:hypothetical protein